MKILIVDDVKLFREMEKSVLQRLHCDVLEACNGKEALEIISRESPDLVLMDLYMPEMSGDECCKIIKGDPSLKKIPVIMVSVANNKEDQGRCYVAGCDDFISKPIHKNLLLKKVGNFLDVGVRASLRVCVDSKVDFTVNGTTYTGDIRNVSECGAFIVSSSGESIGTNMKVRFVLPFDQSPIELDSTVVRVVGNDKSQSGQPFFGMGVKFKNVPLQCKQIIGEYVNFLCIYPS